MSDKIRSLMSFPSNDDNIIPKRKLVSYYYRGWTIQETETGRYIAYSPDGETEWNCPSNEYAVAAVDRECKGEFWNV